MTMLSPVAIKRKSRNDLCYDSKYTTPDYRTGIGYIEGVRGRSDSKDTHLSNHKNQSMRLIFLTMQLNI